MSRWDTFKGWHGEPSFWREVYARTVAGAFTALVVFVAAVAGGYVKLHGQTVAFFGAVLIITVLNLSAAHWASHKHLSGRAAFIGGSTMGAITVIVYVLLLRLLT